MIHQFNAGKIEFLSAGLDAFYQTEEDTCWSDLFSWSALKVSVKNLVPYVVSEEDQSHAFCMTDMGHLRGGTTSNHSDTSNTVSYLRLQSLCRRQWVC